MIKGRSTFVTLPLYVLTMTDGCDITKSSALQSCCFFTRPLFLGVSAKFVTYELLLALRFSVNTAPDIFIIFINHFILGNHYRVQLHIMLNVCASICRLKMNFLSSFNNVIYLHKNVLIGAENE